MKIAIVKTECARCGKEIFTCKRSLLGSESLKRKWGMICEDCITPEEKHQILEDQGQVINETTQNPD